MHRNTTYLRLPAFWRSSFKSLRLPTGGYLSGLKLLLLMVALAGQQAYAGSNPGTRPKSFTTATPNGAASVSPCAFVPTNITVTGIQLLGFNGTYSPNGNVNSAPSWKNTNFAYIIRWSGTQWQLYDPSGSGVAYYTNSTGSITNLPCNTGWVDATNQEAGLPSLSGGCGSLLPPNPPTIVITPNPSLTLCMGSTVTLTASGATSYTWSTGATTAAISTTLGATFSVTGVTNSCSATASATTTRRSLPTGSVTALPSLSICNGQSLTLTASGSAGAAGARLAQPAPPPAGVSYLWSNAASTAAITLTPTSSTVISLTINDGFCPSSPISTSITVSAKPTVTITPTPGLTVTSGSSATLTASGATSYTWSTGASTSAISASTAATYSVTGVTGTCSGTASAALSVTAGTPAAGLNFDGIDDYIQTSVNGPSGSSARTIETWFKTTTDGVILNWGTNANSGAVQMTLRILSGKARLALPPNYLEIPTAVNDGNWHHVAFAFDPTNTAFPWAAYLDGVYQGYATYIPNTTATPIRIGTFSHTLSNFFPGALDEVRIWNRALSDCEIYSHYACELKPAAQTNLLLYYQFNQGTAAGTNTGVTSVTDASGNNNNGTLTNFALTGGTSNWIAPGGVVSGVVCSTILGPVVTISPSSQTITSGSSATLTASGADSYLWSTGETTASIVISATSTTAISVTGTTGPCSATASTVVSLTSNLPVDLTPTISLPQAFFAASGPEATRNFSIALFEVNGKPTSAGTVVITISAPVGYTLAFDNTLTSFSVTGGLDNPVSVSNTNWTQTNNVENRQLTLTIKAGQGIPAMGKVVLGLSITRTSANAGSASNITVNITDDGAVTYDSNTLNNTYSRVINGL